MFGREEVDIGDCVSHFRSLLPDLATPILLLYDVIYAHAIGKVHVHNYSVLHVYMHVVIVYCTWMCNVLYTCITTM